MKISNINEITRVLSLPRLNSYKTYFNLENYNQCFNLYLWNNEVSTSFFRLISIFEVAFRNVLHRELSYQYHNCENKKKDVFNNDWYTYLSKEGMLASETISILRKTTHIKKKTKYGNKYKYKYELKARAPLPGTVIAAQSISFWFKLIETTKDKIDWAVILPKIFKNSLLQEISVNDVLLILDKIVNFRNRIAHHEPLWKISGARCIKDSIGHLIQLHELIYETLGWISVEIKNDYLKSSYNKHFDLICSEAAISSFKHNGSLSHNNQ